MSTPRRQQQNANIHTERGMAALSSSIETDGWIGAITVAADGESFDGSARIEVSDNLEDAIVIRSDGTRPIVHIREDIPTADDPRAVRLGIAANRVAQLNLAWSADVLSSIPDDVDLSGLFTANEWAELTLDDVPIGAGGDDFDTTPDDGPTSVQPGELWRLGEHRLLCGDSTKADDVARLMDGTTAAICFTSPPYDQQRAYGRAIGDWNQLMQGVFSLLPVDDGGQVLVNLGMIHRDGEWSAYWEPWIAWMRDQGWRRFGWYVWDQGPGLPGDWNGRLAPSHEFIFHFNMTAEKARKTKQTKWAGHHTSPTGLRNADGSISGWSHGDRPVQSRKIADSVVRVMRHKARGIEVEHPAVFPVDLVSEMYSSFSDDGDLAYEPFAGSGTAIISGERLGRRVYACEIEPRYCDVILKRWEAETGRTAERVE